MEECEEPDDKTQGGRSSRKSLFTSIYRYMQTTVSKIKGNFVTI